MGHSMLVPFIQQGVEWSRKVMSYTKAMEECINKLIRELQRILIMKK
jgi:hypothetical protein